MARPACTLWQLAHRLYPDEPLDQSGVLDRVFAELQEIQLMRIRIEAVALDSTRIKVHPDGTSLKWLPGHRKVPGRMEHQGASDCRGCSDRPDLLLVAGHAHDAPAGRALLEPLGLVSQPIPLAMDRAYEGNGTRQLERDLGFMPVVPPKSSRIEP